MKLILFKIFNFLGIYVENLHSPNIFLYSLRKMPLNIKQYEIKKKTNYAAIVDNHKYYNDLLKEDIENWNIEVQKPIFIGKGIGASSLDTFRRVSIDGKLYFEKVYFNSFPELENVLWFQENYYEDVVKSIRTAKIEKVYKGKIMSVIYYEFLELNPLSSESVEDSIIQISKKLYKLSKNQLSVQNHIIDFKKHFEYKRNIDSLTEDYSKIGIFVKKFEVLAESSSQILTHGDFQKTNIFQDMTLVDWDSVGFYPIGLEQALIYYRFLFEDLACDLPLNWLLNSFKDVVADEDWLDFERNFVFFLSVFASNLFKENKKLNVHLIVTDYLKEYN